MLGFPVMLDQFYNAKRAQYRGFGEYLDVFSFKNQELRQSIYQMMNNQSYKQAIEKASAIFHSRRMTPRERVAFWVNHTLEFGTEYMHYQGLDVPWYQYLMLDVFVLIVVFILVGISTLGVILYVAWKCCVKRSSKEKQP